MVLEHDGGILKVGNNSWPRSVTGNAKSSDSNAAAHAREVIQRVWGEDTEKDEEERVVGKVGSSKITRRVTVFRAAEKDEAF